MVTPYERDYRREVVPKLSRVINAYGPLIADGRGRVAWASDDLMRLAVAYGAAWLSDEAFWDLEAWIARQLADAATP